MIVGNIDRFITARVSIFNDVFADIQYKAKGE